MTDTIRTIAFRVLTGLIVVAFLFDAYLNLTGNPDLQKELAKVGWGNEQLPLGLTVIFYCVMFLVPYTRKVGFLLMSAHLAGATALEIALGNYPPFIPVLMLVMLWSGMYLKYPEIFRMAPKTGDGASPE